jgi:galactonate dehydratase
MRVAKIDTFKVWANWCNWLLVRVETNEGLHGWGEGSLHGPIESVETAIHELGRVLIGQDPAGPEQWWQRMYHAWRWRGGPTLMSAMAALDIALWDIEGKRLGVPVYRLLGGPVRSSLRVYASHAFDGIDRDEEMDDRVRDFQRRGYAGFKFVPFDAEAMRRNESRALQRAADQVLHLRSVAGDDLEIYIECAERLSPRTVRQAARMLESSRPAWFEEPVPFEHIEEMGRIQSEITIPIATGERLLNRWEFHRLFQSGGCRVAQPDVMHAGGLTEVRKIAMLADLYYIPVAPHNPGGPIATLATMHLCAAIPNFLVLEQMEQERPIRDALSTSPVQIVNGHFVVPSEPGLGTDINVEQLDDYPFQPQPQSGIRSTVWH